jgi:hypothetical protein
LADHRRYFSRASHWGICKLIIRKAALLAPVKYARGGLDRAPKQTDNADHIRPSCSKGDAVGRQHLLSRKVKTDYRNMELLMKTRFSEILRRPVWRT